MIYKSCIWAGSEDEANHFDEKRSMELDLGGIIVAVDGWDATESNQLRSRGNCVTVTDAQWKIRWSPETRVRC